MISFSEIKKGSEYGVKTKTSVINASPQNQNPSTSNVSLTSDGSVEENHHPIENKKLQ